MQNILDVFLDVKTITMPQTTPEYIYVELPIIQQLTSMGWQYIQGSWDNPAITERENFKQVLLTERLKAAIKRINLDDNGNPWLDDLQVQAAVSQLERLDANRLMEANQAATELLLKGTTVLGQDGKQHTVHFIEFNPEHCDDLRSAGSHRNDFLVINQYRVDPPWATGNRRFIVPDMVLLVNGIPLVVIECKSPNLDNPITEAIQDLLKYSNQRGSSQPEGAEKLFHYNLLMIAASRGRATAGTIGANYEHYVDWKDTIPSPQAEIAAQLGISELNSRQTLIAGMLKPANLMDILHNFTLFKTSGDRTPALPSTATQSCDKATQYNKLHITLLAQASSLLQQEATSALIYPPQLLLQ